MGNGGFDNCGTCWFNRRNNGRRGHSLPDKRTLNLPGAPDDPSNHHPPHECVIRGHAIETDPFHTYCANHPDHNVNGAFVMSSTNDQGDVYFDMGPTVPIGPIYVQRSHQEGRVLLVESPDTPHVRQHLLTILHAATPFDVRQLEAFPHRWHVAMWQLGEFRETRASFDLQRIIASQGPSSADWTAHFGKIWAGLRATAVQALALIDAERSQ